MKAVSIILLAVFLPAILADVISCGNTVSTQDIPLTDSFLSSTLLFVFDVNANIKAICAQHTWDQRECACVIEAASKGNANSVVNKADGTVEVGLFSIPSAAWASCNAGVAPCNVVDNVKCAIELFTATDSFSLFSNCDSCMACKAAVSTTKKPTHATAAHAAAHAANSAGGNSGNSGTTYGNEFTNSKSNGGEGTAPVADKFNF